MEMHSSPGDDLTPASERQPEHFLQGHVSKSKVGFAQIDYDQDGVLDGDWSLEFEEKDVEEVLMSTEECDGEGMGGFTGGRSTGSRNPFFTGDNAGTSNATPSNHPDTPPRAAGSSSHPGYAPKHVCVRPKVTSITTGS